MKVIKRITIFALFGMAMAEDPIEVDPATLDFGNVLMGNTSTLSFTITANLEQTVTITPPNFYTVDTSEIAMVEDQTQVVNVIFSPPSIGNYNSFITLVGSTFGSATVAVNATAVNNLEGSLSGTIVSDYSPYEISGDIYVEEGNTLTIEPGVEIIFEGNYSFSVLGTLTAVGEPDSLIKFKSSSDEIYWKGIIVKDSESVFQFCTFENTNNSGFEFPVTGFPSNTETNTIEEFDDESCENFTVSNPVSGCYNGSCSYADCNNISEGAIRFFAPADWNDDNNFSFYAEYNEAIRVGVSTTISFTYSNNGMNPYLEMKNLTTNSEWETLWSDNATGNFTANFDFSNSDLANPNDIINLRFKGGTGTYANSIYLNIYSFNISNHLEFKILHGTLTVYDSDNIILTNSLFQHNQDQVLYIENSDVSLKHMIFHENNSHAISNISYTYNVSLWNSVVIGSISNLDTNHYNYYANPLIIDDVGHLDPIYSPCIDAGHPDDQDECLPPGLGTIATDIGMYGGMNNCGAGDPNLGGGEPAITDVEDMPQDQGGYVGLQFSASLYDGDSDVYDITHYSIWRELDTDGGSNIQFNNQPVGQYYRPNTRDTDGWEYIGDSPAQEFGIYGYTAPTIADSSASDGIFWSKYLLVAHTDNDDIFFVSEPDSGYSVDNIAPFAPANVQVSTGDYGITLSWEQVPENTDIAYYEVYKDDNYLAEITETVFIDSVGYGVSSVYTIRGLDENGNIGAFSDPLDVSNGILGDVTWDGAVDVLDVLNIVDIIMNGTSDLSSGQLWAGELNSDGSIDIYDLILLVDYIMTGGSSARVAANDGEAVIYVQSGVAYLSASAPVYGLQIKLSAAVETANNQTTLEFTHQDEKVLMYTMTNQPLSGEKIALFELPEGITIETAKVSGAGGEPYDVTLGLIPETFAVYQNYPNPFNPETQLKIDLAEISHLSVRVYDAGGREILKLADKEMMPGSHQLRWDGKDANGGNVASGVYFFRVQTPANVKTVKAILLR